MSKRDARIERANAKALKQADKSARLRERPIEKKEVRLGADPGSIFHMGMTWTCDAPDIEGTWTWGDRAWTEDDWSNIIFPKLKEFQNLEWKEIDKFSSDTGHKMHHDMSPDEICEEAQLRLMEIEKYGDDIFRFRLGNKQRLWGFRIVANFEILWFDPKHQIYPTDP